MLKKIVSVLILMPIILIQACTTSKPPTQTGMIKIKMQLLPYFSYAPLYFAQAEGYFAEAGLEVEEIELHGEAAFVALINGELDVSATFLTTLMLSAIYQGENIKVVADKGYVESGGCTVNGILARKDLVESGKLVQDADMVGLTVKYDKVSIQAYIADLVLRSAGYTLEDVNFIDFNTPVMTLEGFATGAVDLAVESEPWITRNINSGNAVIWKDYNEYIPGASFGFIIFGPSILEKNPEAGKRFMVAYLKAIRQYNEGKTDRNLALLEEFTGLDRELLNQICWPTFKNDLSINSQSIIDFGEWAIESQLLEGQVSEEQFWDGSFVDYALKSEQ